MKRRNFLATVLGTVAVVGLTILSFLLLGMLGSWFLSLRIPDRPVVALLPWLTPGVILCFVGLEAIFMLLSPDVSVSGGLTIASRKKLDKAQKKKLILVIVALLLLLLAIVPNYQIVCGPEGITTHAVFADRTYTWDDVTFAAVTDQGSSFAFKLKMKDGKTIDLMGYSTAETRAFVEEYEDMLGYMVFADGQLLERGKFKTVKVSEDLLASLRERPDWERIAPLFEAH